MESRLFHFDLLLLLVLRFFMSFQLRLSAQSDSIFPNKTLTWNSTLNSVGGVFEMGFFAPPSDSHDYYIGIWYKGLPQPERTVVWVANRNNPVSDPFSSWLELGEDGRLVLRTSSGVVVWSTNSTTHGAPPSNFTVGILGDDGNFVIRERSMGKEIWQSFEHPTDTWLPGAKFGYNDQTGIRTILTSWKDTNNPAPGLYSIDVLEVNLHYSEVQMLLKNGSDESKLCFNESSLMSYGSDISYVLAYGCFQIDYSKSYIAMLYDTNDNPVSCLARYVLDVTGQLNLYVWWNNLEGWHLFETQPQMCDSHSQSGKRKEESGNEDDTRKKIDIEKTREGRGNKSATWIAIVASSALLLALLFVGIITVWLRITRRKDSGNSFEATGGDTLKQYKLRDLRRATRNFTQKLGKGGFSTVYRGEFPNSTFIAVKELHDQLREEKQLRAELNTIGLIQHRNLVRLRGFCLADSRRFIVYDYMPNGSLESHLFRRSSNILDWGTRCDIALGTAKGLAYLHEECRDCIIHCDIKPENILLDADYNPKVADFGLAKLLSRNNSRVLTTMRGTRGYLAPEWFSGEQVTAKVDVYSYGQVLFEIISGRRNMDLLNDELSSYFPALVLNALNNGEDVLALVDSKLEGEVNAEELTRACKVACWCIQDHEKDRPTMRQVVQILEGLLDVGIPPIPRFFMSIAQASMKGSDIKGSEAYGTSSSLPTNFPFQPTAQPIQHIP